jgi:hypothetical protein
MTAGHAPRTPPLRRRFLSLPHTRLGWWAVGLAASFVAMFLINGLVFMTGLIAIRAVAIAYGFLLIAVGLGSGIVAILALAYDHERSALVWVALLPGAMVAFLVVGELVAAAFGVTH